LVKGFNFGVKIHALTVISPLTHPETGGARSFLTIDFATEINVPSLSFVHVDNNAKSLEETTYFLSKKKVYWREYKESERRNTWALDFAYSMATL